MVLLTSVLDALIAATVGGSTLQGAGGKGGRFFNYQKKQAYT